MAANEVQQKAQQTLVSYEDADDARSVGQPKLKPSLVVTFTKEEATFDNSVIKRVLADNKANDDHVFVISISGICRSGKSFLINMMANYLDYYCQNGSDDGWEKSASPITGIKWARGQNKSVTQGIWMIVYPNLVEEKRIVFLDCQGTGDNNQSTMNLDNMIMFYALKLSNLTIVNTRNNLTPNDLQSMEVCVLSTQKKRKVADGFQDLVFLIRDWEDDEKPTSLDTLVETTESADVKKSGVAVLKACRSVKSVGLPGPGKKVLRANEADSVLVKDVDEDFLLDCKKLFKQIMIEKPAEASTENASGFYFGHKFRVLGTDTVGKIRSKTEAYLSYRVGEAYEDAQDFLEKKMNEIQGNSMMGKIQSQVKGYLKSLFGKDTRGSREVNSDVKTFKSKVGKMKKAAKEAIETAKDQYLADERVAEYASDERKSEDVKRLQAIVDSVIGKAEDQLETLERKEQMRVEEEKARQEKLELEKMQEELTRKQKELADQEKKQKELADQEKKRKELADQERMRKELAFREKKQKELADQEKKQKELADLGRKRKELADQEKRQKELADLEKQRKELEREQNEMIANQRRLEEERAERKRKEKEIEAARAAKAKRLQKEQTERDQFAQEKFEKETKSSSWCSLM